MANAYDPTDVALGYVGGIVSGVQKCRRERYSQQGTDERFHLASLGSDGGLNVTPFHSARILR